jgi:hypothetical protein
VARRWQFQIASYRSEGAVWQQALLVDKEQVETRQKTFDIEDTHWKSG